jgi:hypothetical protein
LGRGAALTREAKTDGECGWWERRRRRAESANERGCRSRLLPARRHRTRARRFLGPRRRRPRVFVARFDRSLRTRVLTRPAGKTAHERGDTSNGTSPRRNLLQKSEDPSGPPLRDRDTLRGYRGTTSRRSTRRTGDGCPSGCPRPRAQSHLHAVCTPSLRVHAARLRRPPAPPARAAHARRPLAPPACVRHAVLLALRRFGDDARDVSTKAPTQGEFPPLRAGQYGG